jgi:alpha-galactosidase
MVSKLVAATVFLSVGCISQPSTLPLCDFSFDLDGVRYDRRPNGALVETWRASTGHGYITFAQPNSGVWVNCTWQPTESNAAPGATEWVLHFGFNPEAANASLFSGRLSAVCTASTTIGSGNTIGSDGDVWQLATSRGSQAVPWDFEPLLYNVTEPLSFQPFGGRSSDTAFPFFNLLSPSRQWGFVMAIGWTGTWNATFTADNTGGVTVNACLGLFDANLARGEMIRGVSVVLLPFLVNTDQPFDAGFNVSRRYIRSEFLKDQARVSKESNIDLMSLLPMAVTAGGIPFNTIDELNQITGINNTGLLRSEYGLSMDTWWIDAGYNSGGFPHGQGNWTPDPERFSGGSLASVGAAAEAAGLRFLLWFEPERVMPGTFMRHFNESWLTPAPIDLPLWLAYQEPWRLLNLGNPDALQYTIDTLSRYVREWNVDIFRHDFNLYPSYFWAANDEVEAASLLSSAGVNVSRTGTSEVHHIVGLYRLWDALREARPGLMIDVCASGGRRLDVESLRRAVPLDRTDYLWHDAAMVAMTFGLARWTPLYGGGADQNSIERIRSGLAPAFEFSTPLIYQPLASAPSNYWQQWAGPVKMFHSPPTANSSSTCAARWLMLHGDFYPLSTYSIPDGDSWIAWQYNNRGDGCGIVIVTRGKQAPLANWTTLPLRGLDANTTYAVGTWDGPGGAVPDAPTYSGKELMSEGLPCAIYAQLGTAYFPYVTQS